MVGLAMGLQGGFAVVDLIEEDVVRVAIEVDDIEALAAGLFDRRRAVLLDGRQKRIALSRCDVEIDRIDEHSGRLRLGALARRQQDKTGCCDRKRGSGHGN
jgi:hypothetical protein